MDLTPSVWEEGEEAAAEGGDGEKVQDEPAGGRDNVETSGFTKEAVGSEGGEQKLGKAKVTIYKSRLVAKGFMQKEKLDFNEIFAPTAKPPTLHVLLADAAVSGKFIIQMDISTAFLNEIFEEDVYMTHSSGYEDGTGRVCKLKNSIYGLKQQLLCEPLSQGGGGEAGAVSGLRGRHSSLQQQHEGDPESAAAAEEELQEKFIKELGEKYGIENERKVATPLPAEFKLVKAAEDERVEAEEQQQFQSLVGSLLYAAVQTRPDISFSVGQLARVVQNPSEEQVDAAERVVKYLNSNPSIGVQYSASAQVKQKGVEVLKEKGVRLGEGKLFLICFTEATWASEIDDSSSVGGYICVVVGGPVSWKSKKQTETTLSSVESEYMAMFHGVKEVIWLRRLLEEIGQEQKVVFPLAEQQLGNEEALLILPHGYDPDGEDEPAYCSLAPAPEEPASMEEALAGPDREKIKTDDKGQVTIYKSRLVAKGFMQKEKQDFNEIFAPTAKPPTFRVLLADPAVSAKFIIQMDISTAFFNGILEKDVYMTQPPGFEDGTDRVCKLKKSIYGLKQAPRFWYQKLAAVLEEMGFRTSSCDESLFLKGEGEKLVLFLVYVVDILLFSSSMKKIQNVQQQLMKNLKCKTLGEVKYYLRMHVERDLDHRWLKLHQEKFIKELGEKYGIENERKVATPLPAEFKFVKAAEDEGVEA
ncbi:unnamed protein product [Closterium sp. NIES-53]